MCFCFTSNENCHLSSEKTLTPQNRLLIFLGKWTHSETKPWKSSRILRLNPNFFICLSFSSFLHFFHFFSFFQLFIFVHFLHLLSFSFTFFHFLSFSVTFYHFLSLSITFYHVLSCSLHFLSFSFLVGCSKSDFLGLNFVTISLDNSYVKNQFLGPSRVVPLWALFSFFFLLFCFSRF